MRAEIAYTKVMKTIAVIFGGRSTEHDVSIITALASVIKPLELTKEFKIEPVYISRDGSWYWDTKLKDIKLFTSGGIEDFMSRNQPASIRFDGGLTLLKSAGLTSRKQSARIDVVFPAMHGTYGEDGSLMGLLELAGVPYVGCDLRSSVLAMDKVLSKQMAEAHGIPTPKYVYFDRPAIQADITLAVKACTKKLTFPLFVKPAHLGSSIGISRVTNEEELQNALEVAAHYDDKLLAEEAVQNLIEVTLPVMGNSKPEPALLERPLNTSEDFFDFETKYLHGGKGGKKGGGKGSKGAQGYSQLPADIPKALYQKAEKIGLQTYAALGCTGTARIDMLIDSKTGEVYFNEVNPLPGSLYAHNWRIAGVAGVDLVRKLIVLAEERHNSRQSTATAFETSYLKQF